MVVMTEGVVPNKRAVFAIVEQGTEVLLVANKRRAGRIKWSLPGGSVHGTESPLERLKKEVSQETGIEVTNWSEEAIYTSLVKYRGTSNDLDRFTEVYQAQPGCWDWRNGRATDPEDLLRFEDVDHFGAVAGFFSDLPPAGSLVKNLRRYVREPILDWRSLPWEGPRHYEYLVGGRGPDRTVERLVPPECHHR